MTVLGSARVAAAEGYRGLSALALLAAAALPGPARAAAPNGFTIGLEPSLFTGRFGTHHTIHIYDLPLSVVYQHNRLLVRVELPYIAVAGAGIVAGQSVISGRGSGATRQGLGDVWVKAEYRLAHAHGAVPAIEPYVKVKLPVASYRKGLGTGRFDEEAGVRTVWRIGDRVFPYVQLGYRVVGRLPGLHLLNVMTFEPGVAVAVTPRQFVSVILIGHTPIQKRRTAVASAILAYNLRMNFRWELQLYATRGLTSQSAAFGAGLGVMAHF
ncbi:hypothetical protein [Acidocella sp. C78]|uniref:hypothetical protein n=1 Tax=Acidocella sp. C78 TaxID=1671486 RepID=UPI00191BB726|nr:hypothetical protein [Acidocella sp. C78]